MFGFRKKKLGKGFKKLPEVRDLTKDLLGNTVDVYVGTMVGYLTGLNKTEEDLEKAKTDMLAVLQKYVLTEILLDRQKRGHEPSLAELVYLRYNDSYERPARAAEALLPEAK